MELNFALSGLAKVSLCKTSKLSRHLPPIIPSEVRIAMYRDKMRALGLLPGQCAEEVETYVIRLPRLP